MLNVNSIAQNAKQASVQIARLTTVEKNQILDTMAKRLDAQRDWILSENQKDIQRAKQHLDRLTLTHARIDAIIHGIQVLIQQPDHVGEIIQERDLPSGLHLVQKRVGFGVIAVIYESRPNVTVDVCSLCLKSSSAVILKGGKEAIHSNQALVSLLSRACTIPNAFQLISSSDRNDIQTLLALTDYIDLAIPRGGGALIDFVRTHSKVPVIETGTGNCHIFVDESADLSAAIQIIINAKTQRPSVCNAVETVLIHEAIANQFCPMLYEALIQKNVEIRGCKRTQGLVPCVPASEADWATEFLDLIVAVKIVPNLDAAISHINQYGSRHSEAILSRNKKHIDQFFQDIDAACVYANVSTRFTDGGEFGYGAEIGISTQKCHARGPMGLQALTTTKYLVTGENSVRL